MTAVTLGFLIAVRKRGLTSAVAFQWMTVAVGLWQFSFALMLASLNPGTAEFWGRLGCVAATLIAPALYHFTCLSLGIVKLRQLALYGSWAAAVLCAVLFAATNLLVSGVHEFSWGYYPKASPAGWVFALFYTAALAANLFEYWREFDRITSSGTHRTRVRAWLIAFVLPVLACVDLLPAFGVPIFPLGMVPAVIFLFAAVQVLKKYWLVSITPSFAAREIVSTMADGVVVCDSAGRIQVVNQALRALIGYDEHELIGQSLHLFLDPETTLADDSRLRKTLSGARLPDRETIFKAKDGQAVDVSISLSRVNDGTAVVGAVLIVRDIRERKEAEEILRASERRYRDLFERNLAGVFRTSADGQFLNCNDACARIFGYSNREELLQRNAADFYEDSSARSALLAELQTTGFLTNRELCLVRADGKRVWVLENVSLLETGKDLPAVLEGTMVDITDLKNAHEKIEHQAYHDVLTGLPNRKLFADRLSVAVGHARRSPKLLAVLFIDVDRFKVINDTHGHDAGDDVLLTVADRLRSCLRAGDTVARIGGDEFAVLVTELRDSDDAARVAEKLLQSMNQPIDGDGRTLHVSASIGIAVCPIDGEDAESLLKNADGAMYRAKESGRNTYQLCTQDLKDRATQRLTMENSLRLALPRSEFLLYYQPVFDTNRDCIIAVEALLRWKQGDILHSPDTFIPLAEESNLIVPIGQWVLSEAFRQLQSWNEAGFRELRLIVNLSARQFQQAGLMDLIDQIIDQSGADPTRIEMEITESTAMLQGERTIAILQQIRDRGFTISVDDFGVGYSSLNYLKRFPVDAVKVDRSFVRDLSAEAGDSAIVDAVLAIARSLHLRVIAEGVETPEQFHILKEKGCVEFQGYLFSRPLPVDEMTKFLKQHRGGGISITKPAVSAKARKRARIS